MKQVLMCKCSRLCLLFAGLALAGTSVAQESPPSWVESVVVNGDLRLRYEMIREDESEDRDRARFRGTARYLGRSGSGRTRGYWPGDRR